MEGKSVGDDGMVSKEKWRRVGLSGGGSMRGREGGGSEWLRPGVTKLRGDRGKNDWKAAG